MQVRNATAKRDVAQMLEIYRPYVEQTAISFEYDTPSLPDFIHRWEEGKKAFPWLVCEEQGEILGFACGERAFDRAAYDWCAEVTVYVKREERGQGVGRVLYAALEQALAAQGYRILYARVTGSNAQSIRFHESMGYRKVATLPKCGWKLGQWQDLVWMEKRIGGTEPPEAKPGSPAV